VALQNQFEVATASAHPPALPISFGGCFGWLHPAAGRRAVVICGPNGYEALCVHRSLGQFAAALAAAGLTALRFDYPGTGDSAGDDSDPHMMRGALDAIAAAVTLLRSQTGIEQVALIGLRFGAVLAATAAQELARAGAAVDALVLLAPCPSGAAYAKELRVLAMMAKARRPEEVSDLPGLEAAGYHYTPDNLAAMKALDPAAAAERPAARILIADRSDGSGAVLAAAFRARGAVVEERPFAGYTAFMQDAIRSEYPAADFAQVIDWLRIETPGAAAVLPPATPRAEITVPGGIERPVWIDGPTPLFGILGEPDRAEPERAVMLILNTGANHRIGVSRTGVGIARRLLQSGVASLRIDLGGLGDSPSVPGRADRTVAKPELVADVRQAVDWLSARGYRRIVVNGLCAGGWLGYHATLAEPRITDQILLNVQDLWPRPAAARQFESNRDYLRLLFKPHTWARLLKGQVRVREISVVLLSRLASTLAMKLKRLVLGASGAATPAGRTRAELARLGARGVRTEFIYVQSDRGVDELELHFGHRGKMLADLPGVQLTMIAEGDHLFSLKRSRDGLLAMLAAHFDQPPAPAPETAAGELPATRRKVFKGSLA
jgi:alpha/beta superfamily hydrolase